MQSLNILRLTGGLMGLSLLAGAPADDHKEAPHVWLTSNLIGMDVHSPQGDELGEIEDIIVQSNGGTAYAVLSLGSWADRNDHFIALPWSALRSNVDSRTSRHGITGMTGDRSDDIGSRDPNRDPNRDPSRAPGQDPDRDTGRDTDRDVKRVEPMRSLVLSMTREQLNAAPGFDKSNWPNTESADWSKDVDAFQTRHAQDGVKPAVAPVARGMSFAWKASKLDGTAIHSPTGDKLGDVSEIALDTNGRVSFIAMTSGGVLGIGAKSIAVPWGALKFSVGKERGDASLITLASTTQQLETAPEFKSGKEHADEMCDPKWISRVHEHFSAPLYWDNDRTVGGARSSTRN